MVTIAYVMRELDIGLDAAYAVVADARPIIEPNDGFLAQVRLECAAANDAAGNNPPPPPPPFFAGVNPAVVTHTIVTPASRAAARLGPHGLRVGRGPPSLLAV